MTAQNTGERVTPAPSSRAVESTGTRSPVYAIRYLDTDPYGRAGVVVGDFDTLEEAQEIARAIPNYAHVEVVQR